MTIEELNGIVKQVNLRKIKKALKAMGYINCNRDKKLRHVSLYRIANAPYEETPYFTNGKGSEYVGDLCYNVKGYEQYEFVILQFLAPYKRAREGISTKKMLIYAREVSK